MQFNASLRCERFAIENEIKIKTFYFFLFPFLSIHMLTTYTQTDRVHILEDRSLRLDNIVLDDEGEYSCEADNAVGTISATGTLTVNCEYKIENKDGAVECDAPLSRLHA
jgi:Immunoglobulin I-set domain